MHAQTVLFYEDMSPGGCVHSACLVVDRDEMVAFARIWDPLPFHVDEEAGLRAFGGLTAPGLYALAVKQRLVRALPPIAVIESLGYDEVRFHEPLRPGMNVKLSAEWVHRRVSESEPDRGIVRIRFSLVDETGRRILSHLDTVLARRRFRAESSPGNSAAFASS
jgi:acyl dehydratase